MDALRKKISNIKNIDNQKPREQEFLNLISFIDTSLGQAFKLSGDERANFLVTNFLNLRDYLKTEVLTKNISTSIVDIVLSEYDSHQPDEQEDLKSSEASEVPEATEVEEADDESKKNEEGDL